jgi:2-aminoethylphosphonate-pyruvate transaminase
MLLLIPGPVMTHPDVRAAANRDIAPWDHDVRAEIGALLGRLSRLAGGQAGVHVALPLPGSGHFMIEAAIRSFVPPEQDHGHGAGGGILIPATGQYADRMVRLAREAGRRVTLLPASLTQPLDAAAVEAALRADPSITHLGMVYSETSTGVIHDPEAIGAVVRGLGRRTILDAVSAFGALPITMDAHPEIDALIFTPNKCLEALPGFSIAICPVVGRRGAGPSISPTSTGTGSRTVPARAASRRRSRPWRPSGSRSTGWMRKEGAKRVLRATGTTWWRFMRVSKVSACGPSCRAASRGRSS